MQQIITHDQCKRCQECCRFRENRQYFAPVFTPDEVEAARTAAPTVNATFKPVDGDLFQIQLQPALYPDENYQYVCPFLDEAGYACTIYEVRPFDCRIWPLIILKIRETGKIMLAHFTGEVCLAMREVSEAELHTYTTEFARYVRGAKFIEFLKLHPGLIWEHHPEGGYITVSIDDLTALFAEKTS